MEMSGQGHEGEDADIAHTSDCSLPPDRKSKVNVGWIVVAAAFCVHIVHSMQINLTAVILTELANHFQVSVTVLGGLAALRAGVIQFAGNIVITWPEVTFL